jgi:hypothetical protein
VAEPSRKKRRPLRKTTPSQSSQRAKRSLPPNVLALAALPSLGVTSAQMLIEVGITEPATLRAMGAEACFRSLRFHFGRRVSTNFIYALECAIKDIGWKMLMPSRKATLRKAAKRIILELEG